MARYLIKAQFTSEAMASMIKNPTDREEAIRPMFEAMGCTLEQYYFAVGENNVYVLAEIPDNISGEALTMAVLASGAIASTKTTVLLTAQEAIEAMKKAGGIVYRPPAK